MTGYSLGTMPSPDTSTAALARQRQVLRRMTPERRAALAVEMSDEIRTITEAGIRHRHPAYSDAEVQSELARIVLGRPTSACLGVRSGPSDR